MPISKGDPVEPAINGLIRTIRDIERSINVGMGFARHAAITTRTGGLVHGPFLAAVVDEAGEEATYTDERYWITSQYCSNAAGGYAADMTLADHAADSLQIHTTATNLAEHGADPATHNVPTGTKVLVWMVTDAQNSPVPHYVFYWSGGGTAGDLELSNVAPPYVTTASAAGTGTKAAIGGAMGHTHGGVFTVNSRMGAIVHTVEGSEPSTAITEDPARTFTHSVTHPLPYDPDVGDIAYYAGGGSGYQPWAASKNKVMLIWDDGPGEFDQTGSSGYPHWNDSTETWTTQPALPLSPGTGCIVYWNGSAWTVLEPGSNGQVLTMAGGVPTWDDLP